MGRTGDDGSRDLRAEELTKQSQMTNEAGASGPELMKRLSELRIGSTDLFMQATEQTRMAIVIVDPHAEDQPIVYVNRAFVELTGYERDEAIGRNCRFLQGKETNSETVKEIRRCLDTGEVAVVQILNYRKDGTAFWNSLHIGPVYGADGKLAYFYGSQWDVTQRIERAVEHEAQTRAADELQHRMQNLFAVMSAIVRLSSRGEADAPRLADRIVERIEALGRAHRASIGQGGSDKPATSIRSLVEAVLEPYRNAEGHKIELNGEDVQLPARMVTPIGVALHELATNAMKYGALGLADGDVAISWSNGGDDLLLEWSESRQSSANPKPTPTAGHGSGSRIVQGVLQSLGGTIQTDVNPAGYDARITIPLPDDA